MEKGQAEPPPETTFHEHYLISTEVWTTERILTVQKIGIVESEAGSYFELGTHPYPRLLNSRSKQFTKI